VHLTSTKSALVLPQYRLLYDFAIDPTKPVKDPCSFTLKAWDKVREGQALINTRPDCSADKNAFAVQDPLSFKSELLGFTEVPLADLVNDGIATHLRHQERQQQVDSLLKHGRMVEMEELLRKFKRENAEYIQRRLNQQAVADRSSTPDFVPVDINELQCGCCDFGFDMECGCMAKFLDYDDDDDALHATAKYRREHGRTWTLQSPGGGPAGKVTVTIELLHKDVADAHPAGKGRSKPNKHPVLEEPEREKISFWRPFGV
jgi:hypothetical protein